MTDQFKPIYSPALRMKAGELDGLRQLATDVAVCVLPRIIIPPKGERSSKLPLLFEVSDTPDVSAALSLHWRDRPALIDASYILDEYGREKLGSWLPKMFERARNAGVIAVPTATLSDINAESTKFRPTLDTGSTLKFAVVISSDEMVGPESDNALKKTLDLMGLQPQDCAVIADFGGSEFGDPSIVAPIIGGVLERLQSFGLWQHIIFQGTHYPEVNPAKDGEVAIWPRNEWLAWKEAVHFDPSTAEHMIFGDYAADSSKIEFGSSGAPAIRHLRYATGTNWLIPRATKLGSDSSRMRAVYRAITASSGFAGAGFSEADAFIARAAVDADVGPGNSKTWRQLNTTHHITQAVVDIAKVRGIAIKKGPAKLAETQLSLSLAE